MKIGVFDSGIGGITVLSALRAALPEVDYIYLGDTANLPYGTKSPAQVVQLSLNCGEFLRNRGVDAVVVACNTASSLALEALRAELAPIPVYGVVEPGVQTVLGELMREPRDGIFPVLVLATRATINSKSYGNALRQQLDQDSRPVFEQACPLLVPLIEEGWVDHPVLHQTIAEYVGKYRERFSSGIALLGCTHYPWIQAAIEAALPGWTVVNSANAIAGVLKAEMPPEIARNHAKGALEWVFTDSQALPEFARRFIAVQAGVDPERIASR